MAILDRIRRQDAGEVEPPAIALTGQLGANPASEDFLEQSARASRQSAASTADAAAEDEISEDDLENLEEVRSQPPHDYEQALLAGSVVVGQVISFFGEFQPYGSCP